MKKLILPIISLIGLNTLLAEEYIVKLESNTYKNNIIVQENSNLVDEVEATPPIINYGSCLEILEAGLSTGDGVYMIDNGSKDYEVYCDMTTNGGGWTLVFAQYENDPVTDWNEGIQPDYDPSLSSNRGFALNSSELPNHTQIAKALNLTIANNNHIFNGIYSTSPEIAVTLVTNLNGVNYQIHRSQSRHYGSHDPEAGFASSIQWNNTLTIDEVGNSYSYAFAPNYPVASHRGYSFENPLYLLTNTEAWTLFVR